MRRFVENFNYPFYPEEPTIEDKINDYADRNNLTIIGIAPANGNGIYVLFEEKEE